MLRVGREVVAVITNHYEADDDPDGMSDLDLTCPECGGDGMEDDVMPCPYCDGEGSQWWLA